MINNILISRETRKVSNKYNRFIGIEGENLQEVLVFNLDQPIEGNAIIEILFPDETTAYIEIEKTDRGYELPVKSSLLKQKGIIKMQLKIVQAGQEIFKSEIIRFDVEKSINATTTIPEDYPTWIDNLEALKLNLENAEKQRVEAEKGRVDAEKQRVESFNQMGQAVDNAIGNIADLQEAYDKNAQDKIKEFNDNAGNKLKEHNTNATNKMTEFNENVVKQTENIDKHVEDKITEYDEHTEELTNRLDSIDEKDTAQDKLIEDLQNQIIDLETENENIKNQFPTGEAEGENITLNDSAEMEFKELRIGGNSWQETRSGRNLFDASKIPTDVGIVVEDKGRTIKMPIATEGNGGRSTGKKLSGLCPNLKVGDVVNLHFNRSLQVNNNNIIYIIGADSPEWGNGTNRTITQKDLDGLVVLYGNRFVSGETEQCILTDFSIMLASETDTSWEQFGQMPSPEFRSEIRNVTGSINETICNGNLLNPEKVVADSNNAQTYIEDGFIRFRTGPEVIILRPSEIKEKTPYTFNLVCKSGVVSENNIAFRAYYSDGTREDFTSYKRTNTDEFLITFTTNKEKTLSRVNCAYSNGLLAYLKIEGSMILEGEYTADNMPEYQPHQSQQFTFPLSEGQRMYKDSYLADDGVHHLWGEYMFDGTEAIAKDANYTQYDYYYLAKLPDGMDRLNMDVSNIKNAVCSHFKYIPYSFDKECCWTTSVFGMSIKNETIGVTDEDDVSTRKTKFKAYLAEQYANGTPVKLQYPLAEEVIEPYTEEQHLVYNEIKKAHSYKNVTHIFSTDEIKPIVKTIYRKDLETHINNEIDNKINALTNAIIELGGTVNV